MDPAPLPPGAVLDGPRVGGRMLNDWRDLAGASQKERDLIIKISGFHETAWGARSVVLGSDCSREEWQQGVEQALAAGADQSARSAGIPETQAGAASASIDRGRRRAARRAAARRAGCGSARIILWSAGQARLSGALATFCPPDKKIIHGMQDAALLPARVVR